MLLVCFTMAEPFLLCKVFIVDCNNEVVMFVSKILTLCFLMQYIVRTFRKKKIMPPCHTPKHILLKFSILLCLLIIQLQGTMIC